MVFLVVTLQCAKNANCYQYINGICMQTNFSEDRLVISRQKKIQIKHLLLNNHSCRSWYIQNKAGIYNEIFLGKRSQLLDEYCGNPKTLKQSK